MALQRNANAILWSSPVDGAPVTPVAANLIMVATATGVALSGAKALGFAGVTTEATDTNGYVALQSTGIVQINSSAAITMGALVASDATGNAVTVAPGASSGTNSQVVGVALNAATAINQLVDVLLTPYVCLV